MPLILIIIFIIEVFLSVVPSNAEWDILSVRDVARQLIPLDEDIELPVDSKFVANRILSRLSIIYPLHRFIVAVHENKKEFVRVTGVNEKFVFFDLYDKRVVILSTFAVEYAENMNCYAKLKKEFKARTCDTPEGLYTYLEENCSKDVIRFVGPADSIKLAFAYSLPKSSFRDDIFECHQGSRKVNWRIVVADFNDLINLNSLNATNSTSFHNINFYDMDLHPRLSGDQFCINNFAFMLAIIIATILFFLFLSILTLLAFFLWKFRKLQASGRFGFYLQGNWFLPRRNCKMQMALNGSAVDIEQLIYSGPNSRVYFGQFIASRNQVRDVAVKVPSPEAFKLDTIIEETRINGQLRHKRVVEYIGFYRDAYENIRIVSEFMHGKDLHSYIASKNKNFTIGHLLNYFSQIAEGMQYLASKKIIHRDLAARNCMLTKNCAEIKITDFGLSRYFNIDANYVASSPVRLPLRWTAIDCLGQNGEVLSSSKFSEKSDVWSFGVVTWECFMRGAMPYGSSECDEFSRLLNTGWRLECPKSCPSEFYAEVMLKCWEECAEQRPTFAQIGEMLAQIFNILTANEPEIMMKLVDFENYMKI